jgi:hypothetical protein
MRFMIVMMVCVSPCVEAEDVRTSFLNTTSLMFLISRSDVQEELELLDDQKAAVDSLSKRVRAEVNRATMVRPSAGVDPDREMREQVQKIESQALKDLETILLPHQMKRLCQIDLQYRVRATSFYIYATPEIAKALEYSPAQAQEITQLTKALSEEMKATMLNEIKKADEAIRAKLTPEQQLRYQDVFGEPFEFGPELLARPARPR